MVATREKSVPTPSVFEKTPYTCSSTNTQDPPGKEGWFQEVLKTGAVWRWIRSQM